MRGRRARAGGGPSAEGGSVDRLLGNGGDVGHDGGGMVRVGERWGQARSRQREEMALRKEQRAAEVTYLQHLEPKSNPKIRRSGIRQIELEMSLVMNLPPSEMTGCSPPSPTWRKGLRSCGRRDYDSVDPKLHLRPLSLAPLPSSSPPPFGLVWFTMRATAVLGMLGLKSQMVVSVSFLRRGLSAVRIEFWIVDLVRALAAPRLRPARLVGCPGGGQLWWDSCDCD